MAQNLTLGWSVLFYPLTGGSFSPNGSGREYKADPYGDGVPGYFVFTPSRSMTLAASAYFFQYPVAGINVTGYDPFTDEWTAVFYLQGTEERTVSYLVGNTVTYKTVDGTGTGTLTIDTSAATLSGQTFTGTGETTIPINVIMEISGMEVV